MLRRMSMCLLLSLLTTAVGAAAQASAGGPSPAVLTAIERMKADGFSPTAPGILEMEGLVRSQLLSQSGVQVLEIKREVPGVAGLLYEMGSVSGQSDLFEISEYLEAVSLDVDDETTMLFTRPVPPEEIERRRLEAVGIAREQAATALELYSGGAVVIGAALREGLPFLAALAPADGVDGPTPIVPGAAGLIVGGCGREAHGVDTGVEAMLGDSWLSPDPLTFMTGIACFTMFTAEVLRTSDLTEEEKRARIARAREQAAERIRLLGEETVDGRPTYVLTMTDLGLSQTLGAVPGVTVHPSSGAAEPATRVGPEVDDDRAPVGGPSASDRDLQVRGPTLPTGAGLGPTIADDARVEIHTATVWIDRDYFVRRKTRFEGIMHAEGQSREFFMERLERDYRDVPGTALYEPHLTVLRVGGMTTPEQEREMQEAVAQLEEFDRQMAGMPESQRAMVERMMGDKMEQARALARGGAVEFEMITTGIVVNPDLAAGALALLDEGSLVRVIQQDLATLGYDPGPVSGELTEQTVAAIVAFQTEAGLEPTGEATPALASALKAAIAGR